MVFISFVLTIPTSRPNTGDRVEPFSSRKGEGLEIGTEEESASTSPFRQSGFVRSTFLSIPAIGDQPVFRGKEGTGASIGVLKSEAIGAATISTEARHPFAPPDGNASFDAGKEAITEK